MAENNIIRLGKLRRLTAGLSDDIDIAVTPEGILIVDNEETESKLDIDVDFPNGAEEDPFAEPQATLPPPPKPVEPRICITKEIISLTVTKGKRITADMVKQFLDVYIKNTCKMEGPCCHTTLNNVLFKMTNRDGRETDRLLNGLIFANQQYIQYATSGN